MAKSLVSRRTSAAFLSLQVSDSSTISAYSEASDSTAHDATADDSDSDSATVAAAIDPTIADSHPSA